MSCSNAGFMRACNISEMLPNVVAARYSFPTTFDYYFANFFFSLYEPSPVCTPEIQQVWLQLKSFLVPGVDPLSSSLKEDVTGICRVFHKTWDVKVCKIMLDPKILFPKKSHNEYHETPW